MLRGNLVPGGGALEALGRHAALMQHRGRAVVFEDIEHYKQRIVDPALAVDPSSVLVLEELQAARLSGQC